MGGENCAWELISPICCLLECTLSNKYSKYYSGASSVRLKVLKIWDIEIKTHSLAIGHLSFESNGYYQEDMW